MGFMDKAKAMADQAISSMDSTFAPDGENDRRGEQLFRDLGALTWAQHRGSATQATADEIQTILEELAKIDPQRSLNVVRKHVHSGGTSAAPPPPPGQATHTAAGVATAPPPPGGAPPPPGAGAPPVSYTHLRAHETVLDLVCRLLLEKNNNHHYTNLHTSQPD